MSNDLTEIDLEGCPLCGSTNLMVERFYTSLRIRCLACNIQVSCATYELTAKTWNTRVEGMMETRIAQRIVELERDLAFYRDYAGSQTLMSDFRTADEMRAALVYARKANVTELEYKRGWTDRAESIDPLWHRLLAAARQTAGAFKYLSPEMRDGLAGLKELTDAIAAVDRAWTP